MFLLSYYIWLIIRQKHASIHKQSGSKMNLLKKITMGLTVVAMAPLANLERKKSYRPEEKFKQMHKKLQKKSIVRKFRAFNSETSK
jgi:hypothetical protein